MSMVKQIVDLSSGTIDVRSELGKGTEIKLSLPLENCIDDSDKILDDSDPLYAENPINAVRRKSHFLTRKLSSILPPRARELKILRVHVCSCIFHSILEHVKQHYGEIIY
jgi:hypothetical protein